MDESSDGTTDREALLALLARFGLEPATATDTEVVLEAKVGGVDGYSDFYCWWTFDDVGRFKEVSIHE